MSSMGTGGDYLQAKERQNQEVTLKKPRRQEFATRADRYVVTKRCFQGSIFIPFISDTPIARVQAKRQEQEGWLGIELL